MLFNLREIMYVIEWEHTAFFVYSSISIALIFFDHLFYFICEMVNKLENWT